MTKIVKTTLKIKGMHCSSCALNIDFDLEDLEGVKSVNTNYARGESVVLYDEEKVKLEQITSQIKKTGYEVQTDN